MMLRLEVLDAGYKLDIINRALAISYACPFWEQDTKANTTAYFNDPDADDAVHKNECLLFTKE